MKAIFSGSLSSGFDLARIVPDDQAETVLESIDAPHAEALDIERPSDRFGNFDGHPEGLFVIVFCDGLSGGATVFGPWQDQDDAEEWAEYARDSDEEWQMFEVPTEG